MRRTILLRNVAMAAATGQLAAEAVADVRVLSVWVSSVGGKVPFTSMQRSASISEMYATVHRFNLPSCFLTFAFDASNGILFIRMRKPTAACAPLLVAGASARPHLVRGCLGELISALMRALGVGCRAALLGYHPLLPSSVILDHMGAVYMDIPGTATTASVQLALQLQTCVSLITEVVEVEAGVLRATIAAAGPAATLRRGSQLHMSAWASQSLAASTPGMGTVVLYVLVGQRRTDAALEAWAEFGRKSSEARLAHIISSTALLHAADVLAGVVALRLGMQPGPAASLLGSAAAFLVLGLVAANPAGAHADALRIEGASAALRWAALRGGLSDSPSRAQLLKAFCERLHRAGLPSVWAKAAQSMLQEPAADAVQLLEGTPGVAIQHGGGSLSRAVRLASRVFLLVPRPSPLRTLVGSGTQRAARLDLAGGALIETDLRAAGIRLSPGHSGRTRAREWGWRCRSCRCAHENGDGDAARGMAARSR